MQKTHARKAIVFLIILIWIAGCTPVGSTAVVTATATTKLLSPTIAISPPTSTPLPPTEVPIQPKSTLTPRPTSTETPLTPLDGRSGGLIAFDQYDFQGSEGGTRDLYVMNADESGLRRLMRNHWDDFEPAWSPDGTRIAFTSNRNSNLDVFILTVEEALQNIDAANQWPLTTNQADDGHASWSPDGSRIAFESNRDGNWEIYLIDADGSNLQRITDHKTSDRAPDWSPDGTRIAFESARDGDIEIYIIDVNGANLQQLTDNLSEDHGPAWSPDGTSIAYYATTEGGWEIFVMNVPQGSTTEIAHSIRLTNKKVSSYQPDWSPDGTQISFVTHLAGENPGLYLMNANGSNQRFMSTAAGCYTQAWQAYISLPTPIQ